MQQEKIQALLEAEASAILAIPSGNDYQAAVELLFTHVHQKKARAILCGIGKAGEVAKNFASTLSSTGTPAVFLHPSEAQHGDLGLLHKDDVLILISNSGKTRELLELVELSKRLHGKMPIIVISGNKESPLARSANVILHTGGPEEVCPLGLTPTTSIITMLAISHVMVSILIEQTGFSKEDYFKRHHGGYLGSVLKEMDL